MSLTTHMCNCPYCPGRKRAERAFKELRESMREMAQAVETDLKETQEEAEKDDRGQTS